MNIAVAIITFERSKVFRECAIKTCSFLQSSGIQHSFFTLHNDQSSIDAHWAECTLNACSIIPSFNTGVAGGRNLLLKKILSYSEYFDWILFIDDDAHLISFNLKTLCSDNNIVIIAFKSLDINGAVRSQELPYGVNEQTDALLEVANFVGVAHLFRVCKIISDISYDNAFVYGFEEIDYSLSVIARKRKIYYDPSMKVIHLKDSKGRFPSKNILYMRLKNKISIAQSYFLPPHRWLYIMLNTLICLLRSKSLGVFKVIFQSFTVKNRNKRLPIRSSLFIYSRLIRLKFPLFW